MKTLKHLLGVRQTTRADTLLLELGIDKRRMVKDRQVKFMAKLDKQTPKLYIHNVIDLAIQKRTTVGTQIWNHQKQSINHTNQYLAALINKLRIATSTKRQEYVTLNPTLESSPLYRLQGV